MNGDTDGRPRDPFEEAADEEFHRTPLERRSETAPPPTMAPEAFGRDGAGAAAETPEVPDADVAGAHTPIAGTPPDDPLIYDRASRARASREARADEEVAVATNAPTVDGRPIDDPVAGDPTDDPTGERFRTGPFGNEPGWLRPGPKNAQLCYWMNLAGFVVWPLPLASVGVAVVNRPKVGAALGTHYTYAMRTVFLAVLYGLLASAMGRVGGIALLAVVVWFVWRNLRGLARAGAGQPMPNPRAWF